MKTHGEYFFAAYEERSFFMELKTIGLTKKVGSKTAVDDLNIDVYKRQHRHLPEQLL